jgi:hypothetical protein
MTLTTGQLFRLTSTLGGPLVPQSQEDMLKVNTLMISVSVSILRLAHAYFACLLSLVVSDHVAV